jgi:hypothetical protein
MQGIRKYSNVRIGEKMSNPGPTQENAITAKDFTQEWLSDVRAGEPSTVELGRRFAQKLVTQWLDVSENSDDLVYCDGAGDGGIDVAFLNRGETVEGEEPAVQGDTWYLVQSKYGKAFQGTGTLLAEGQKVIDTLDGKRPKLSSLTEGLLDRLKTFRGSASERDRLVLVFATEASLTEDEKRAMGDLRAMGRKRLGSFFDVESVSIETIYQRTLETLEQARIRVVLKSNLADSGAELLVGSTPLIALYGFMKDYRSKTEDLDRLYEKNVRKFLGMRGRVNKAIQDTLERAPDRFGLYNNGITIVVEDFETGKDGEVTLTEPFIVNGCQTTRTIWEVFHRRLEAGGTGQDEALKDWKTRAGYGVVVTKVVKVGIEGEQLLEQITRHTNTQNAIREKDFLALTSDFRTWARAMEDTHDVYLEIQRGGWDSRRTLQKQKPGLKQFKEAANAFDLLKVYGAGWLGEAGLAFGKNPPFLPNGTVFKKIMNDDVAGENAFGVDNLLAAYRLQYEADGFHFGRGAPESSRRQTRFLFYMVVIDLLRDVMTRSKIDTCRNKISAALLKIVVPENESAKNALMGAAIEAIDSYLTSGTDNSLFDEPVFVNKMNNDLNAFMKWEKLGKSEADTPRFRQLLAVTKQAMAQHVGGQPSAREQIAAAIKG